MVRITTESASNAMRINEPFPPLPNILCGLPRSTVKGQLMRSYGCFPIKSTCMVNVISGITNYSLVNCVSSAPRECFTLWSHHGIAVSKIHHTATCRYMYAHSCAGVCAYGIKTQFKKQYSMYFKSRVNELNSPSLIKAPLHACTQIRKYIIE